MTVRRLRETRSGMMSSWPSGWGWQDPAAIPPPGLFNQQRAGVVVTTHTAMQVDAVYTALRVISNGIIKMGPPAAYTKGYDSHNRWYREYLGPKTPAIVDNTFGNMFQFDGMARSIVSLGLFGELFWAVIARDEMEYPTAVEVLNPAFVAVEPVKGKIGQVSYWYGSASTKVQVPNEDMVHIPFLAMPGARRGLSSIEYAGVAYAIALAAMEYGARWFAQGASPSFILSTEQKLGQEEVERIAQKFLVEHSGLQSAHLPLVVDQGLKVDRLSVTPDEAQFLGTLEYARSVIAAWFGLPGHLVGGNDDKGNVWGKTVQEQGFQMQDFTFSGYTTRIEEAYRRLVPAGVFVHFTEEMIQRADSENAAKLLIAERQATVRTPNEIRVTRYREAPVAGGDDILSPLASNAAVAVNPEPGEEPSVPAATMPSNAPSGGQV